MIPYVISIAYPDYKRPFLLDTFGKIEEDKIESFFIQEMGEFILEKTYGDYTINDVNDIKHFFMNYYSDYYMDNSPWKSMIFINNTWEDCTPCYESVLTYIKNISNDNELCEDEEDIEDKENVFSEIYETSRLETGIENINLSSNHKSY